MNNIVRSALAGSEEQTVLVILGSGMGASFAGQNIQILCEWRGKGGEGVDGHPGLIARWESNGVPLLLAMGRRHLYEGYAPNEIAELINVAGSIGLRRLVITNAAGGLNPLLHKGEIVLHAGYLGSLIGPFRLKSTPTEESGKIDWPVRSASPLALNLYPAIRTHAMEKGVLLREGIYAGVIGPNYETRAEIRMLRTMGADLVGMSTVTEVEAAARFGMQVVGLSLVTNVSSDTVRSHLLHEEVTETSAVAAEQMLRAIQVSVQEMAMPS